MSINTENTALLLCDNHTITWQSSNCLRFVSFCCFFPHFVVCVRVGMVRAGKRFVDFFFICVCVLQHARYVAHIVCRLFLFWARCAWRMIAQVVTNAGHLNSIHLSACLASAVLLVFFTSIFCNHCTPVGVSVSLNACRNVHRQRHIKNNRDACRYFLYVRKLHVKTLARNDMSIKICTFCEFCVLVLGLFRYHCLHRHWYSVLSRIFWMRE